MERTGPDAQVPELVDVTAAILAPLDHWLDRLADGVQVRCPVDGRPSPESFASLRQLIEEALGDLAGLAKGCGFMAAPDALEGARLFQEWWQLLDGRFQRLELDFREGSESFYDYSLKEYFAVPARTLQPYVEGPYVDYLGIDEYIFTFVRPVVVGGRFVGHVGADVALEALQQRLLDRGITEPCTVALVNQKGRVILASDAAVEPGSLLRLPALTAWLSAGARVASQDGGLAVWPCGSSWAVVALDEASAEPGDE